MNNFEIKENGGKTRQKSSILIVLALFSLLLLMRGSISFESLKEKFAAAAGLINPPQSETRNSPSAESTFKPIFTGVTDKPSIHSLSYLAVWLSKDKEERIILAEKNSEDLLPMASVTKLMTAIVASKHYEENEIFTMPEDVFVWQGSSKRFMPGSTFKTSELRSALLIESNNDAAMAFADKMGREKFINKMNEEAASLGIINTRYDNPTGLDPRTDTKPINHSTAKELLILTEEIIKKHPQILTASSLREFEIKTAAGNYNHTAISTNKFLNEEKLLCRNEPLKILGGKTGYTDLAKKNLVLVAEAPNGEGYLVTIVLSADDNFLETKNLMNWICDSYEWPGH